jgi:hypothetical protein
MRAQWIVLLAFIAYAAVLSVVAETLDGTPMGRQMAQTLSALLPFAERLARAPRPDGQIVFYAVLFWTAPLFVMPLWADERRRQLRAGLPPTPTGKWWGLFASSLLMTVLALCALWLALGAMFPQGSSRSNPFHSVLGRIPLGAAVILGGWLGVLTAGVQIYLLQWRGDEMRQPAVEAKSAVPDETR